MTLNTVVYIEDEVSPHDVLAEMNRIIKAPENVATSDEPLRRAHDGDLRLLMNRPSQGLPAWVMVEYRVGAPLRTPEQAAEDHIRHSNAQLDPPAYVELSFDTAYGYDDDEGRSCGDLHAWIIATLAPWFEERGLAWSWRNESTGEIFRGTEGIDELCSSGAAAKEWFANVVAPAIGTMLAKSGQEIT